MRRQMNKDRHLGINLTDMIHHQRCDLEIGSLPTCVPDAGDIPYGHLLGVEEPKINLTFTDSVKHLYLPDAELE